MISDESLAILRSNIPNMKLVTKHDKVYKDECIYSFDTPYSDNGLFLNIITLQSYGKDYINYDIDNNNQIYLHLKYTQTPKVNETNDDPNKLAIGIDGGFNLETKYNINKEYSLVIVTNIINKTLDIITLPNNNIPEFIINVINSIINHDGMNNRIEVNTWEADNEKFESKYAKNLIQLNPNNKKISQDPKQWKDEETGDTNNLWLNLSTGYIGGGRKNWDGSGGSGSALRHYEDTGKKYPLAVKLGTITPHGADVWSYANDEDALVIDPYLSEHLSFWGINIMKLEKTEKTLSELEVDLNKSYDWSKIMEGTEELQLLSAPGYIGLKNIGSSCYMNSVLQTLLSIPEVGYNSY